MSPAPAASRASPRARLVLLAVLLSGACGGAPAGPPRPHVLLVSIDTLRADRLGCYGHDRPTSPHLDALAGESLLFERCFANAIDTLPSHMTMLTGVLPPVHGLRHRDAAALAPTLPTLAERLARAGWRTAAFAGGGYVVEPFGFARGFQSFHSRYETIDDQLARVQAWLQDAPDEPTFLFLHTYAVHAPYLPAPRHDLFSDPGYAGDLRARVMGLRTRLESGRDDLGALAEDFWRGRGDFGPTETRHLLDLYDGCIHEVDAALGRLLASLRARGWLDRAWLVVTSDHGEAFDEHGTFEHRQLHQAELHVPLLVRPPGGVPGGRRLHEPASLLDLLPTLLAATGQPAEAWLQGRDLLADAAPAPVLSVSHHGERAFSLIDWPRKLLAHDGQRALLDLSADPGERQPLPATPGNAASAELEQALAAWLEASAALRARVGEPQQGATLAGEQLEALRALGYVR